MLCSRRGMHPMDCRIACDLSVVRHHRIYRKLSGDMLGACVSAMMVSDCPHGQETRIPQRKLSPKMPPHGAFQPNPHRRGHRQGQEIKSAFSFDYDHEASQPAATPQACRPGGHSQRPGRSVVPAHSLWAAGGPRCWGRPAKGTAVKNRLRSNAMTVTTG